MAHLKYTVQVAFKNKRALRALGFAAQHIEETCGDSWNPEAQRALRAIRYAMKNIQVVATQDGVDLLERDTE